MNSKATLIRAEKDSLQKRHVNIWCREKHFPGALHKARIHPSSLIFLQTLNKLPRFPCKMRTTSVATGQGSNLDQTSVKHLELSLIPKKLLAITIFNPNHTLHPLSRWPAVLIRGAWVFSVNANRAAQHTAEAAAELRSGCAAEAAAPGRRGRKGHPAPLRVSRRSRHSEASPRPLAAQRPAPAPLPRKPHFRGRSLPPRSRDSAPPRAIPPPTPASHPGDALLAAQSRQHLGHVAHHAWVLHAHHASLAPQVHGDRGPWPHVRRRHPCTSGPARRGPALHAFLGASRSGSAKELFRVPSLLASLYIPGLSETRGLWEQRPEGRPQGFGVIDRLVLNSVFKMMKSTPRGGTTVCRSQQPKRDSDCKTPPSSRF